ncbi:MAG: putative capsular polysaccharide synthesis family protein [Candidatus Hermodarchaeota archaeon]
MLIAFLKQQVPLSIANWFRIHLQNFNVTPPIIIYQVGKVGSTTVYKSLKNARLRNPVYHLHFLSDEGIKSAEEYHLGLERPVIPNHIRLSKLLRKKMDKTKGVKWKIITLVRDPIGRDISNLFESIEHFYPNLVNESGNVKINEAIEFLLEMFSDFDESTDYTARWFDTEINAFFDIDVYTYPFNHQKGFTIIRDKNVEIVIIRLEDLNRNFNEALTQFLNLDKPIEMCKAGIREEAVHAAAYKHIREEITIPRSVCNKIYSSKYARHFYDDNMRNKHIQKWSKEN